MAARRSRGNGTSFDWLRYSFDISKCDLSPDENPEKYGRPMKSAIPLGPKWPCPRGHMFYKDLNRENVKTIFLSPPRRSSVLQRSIMGKREKIFLSETRGPRALIFGM